MDDARAALQRYFGFREYLDGQEGVVSALVEGRDALVIMPTGGGKSLCYQLPALVKEGVTIVVSPLIALMKDQVDGLAARGVPATMINSTVPAAEQRERIEGLREGRYKLVYIAPERFRHRAFTEALGAVPLALFAIDEAHCLSQWGHDFRPDYLRLGSVLEKLGRPQTAAFTATATPAVRDDILGCLKLRDPFVSLSGFERPNLSLRVTHTERTEAKFARVAALVAEHKTGIVYCATRKRVDEVSAVLKGRGVSFIPYHGGMEDAVRERAQDLFMKREVDVVVSTNAFGMGIDRADVRFVVHFDVPGSIEAYYQEAGRAGRDGEPAVCELLFNFADTRTQEFFIEGSNPGYELICELYELLRRRAGPGREVELAVNDLADGLGANNNMGVSAALAALGRARAIERYDIPGQRTRGTRVIDPNKAASDIAIDRAALAEKERRDRSKLEAMVRFCYADTCRQEFILDYFGEEDPAPCGTCDFCRAQGTHERRPGTEEEVTRLRKALSGVARTCTRSGNAWHPRFGKGKIVQMLVGGRSQEVLGARLDELTTYGILKAAGSAYVYDLLRAAERAGLVRTEKDGNYPLLGLTPRGAEAMRTGEVGKLAWPAGVVGGGGGAPAAELGAVDGTLYEKLRQTRAELAQAHGGVPSYVIFGNATLEALAAAKPATAEEALALPGIGEVKAERYLPAFLEVIREHAAP